MDPLSDVLSLLKPRSSVAGAFDVGGDWAVSFPRHDGIKCYAVLSGQCWLVMEGIESPVLVRTGECFLLPRGRPFRMETRPGLTPLSYETFASITRAGGIATVGGGGDFMMAGSHFLLGGEQASVLLGVLPPIVHIGGEADRAAMRWSMDRMRQELSDPQPGGHLVIQHLAQLMLVQALRLHLAEGAKGGVGWLFALADRQMGAAIGAMHAEPACRWTLQALAERAGMSRSTFALRFKETVGSSPMDYLTRWRMLLAGDRLETTAEPVSAIALSLGYESESAFSTAFKRVMGCSPRRYGRRQAPVAAEAALAA